MSIDLITAPATIAALSRAVLKLAEQVEALSKRRRSSFRSAST